MATSVKVVTNISGGSFVQSQIGTTNSTLSGYIAALQIDNHASAAEQELKRTLAELRRDLEQDPKLSVPQKQAAVADLTSFTEELQRPAAEQNPEAKKLFWGRFTEVTKFSAALVTLAAAVAKLTGLA